jgi:hypothetical protein
MTHATTPKLKEKIYNRPWNIFEITSPIRGTKCYWFDQSAKPKNGTFRSKIRSRYLIYANSGTLNQHEPIYEYGDHLSVSVEFIQILPKDKTLEEVKKYCREMTERNKQLYEEYGHVVSYNKMLKLIV